MITTIQTSQNKQLNNRYYARTWFDLGMKALDESSQLLVTGNKLIRDAIKDGAPSGHGRDLIEHAIRKNNIAIYCLRRSRLALDRSRIFIK